MRETYTETDEFYDNWETGFEAYIEGDWEEA